MKNRILLVLLVALSFSLNQMSAQERYLNTRYITNQHFINPVLINPGAAGFSGHHDLLFNYRNLWASFGGGANTIMLNYSGPVGNRVSLGVGLVRDVNGHLGTTKGLATFAYNIESEINKVGIGISAEYLQHKLSGDALGGALPADPNDVLLQDRLDGNSYFEASFGVYGLYDKRLSYGLTLPTLFSSKIEDSVSGDTEYERPEFSYVFNLGYVLEFKEEDIFLEPSVYVKKLFLVPTHIDLAVKIQVLEKKLTGGLIYSLGADEKLGFLIGAKMNSLNFNYTYNVSRRDFQDYNNGSHELSIGIRLAGNSDK